MELSIEFKGQLRSIAIPLVRQTFIKHRKLGLILAVGIVFVTEKVSQA
jgi:hypothetical protein